MKITIDLNDPSIHQQIERIIDERLSALTADRIDAIISPVIATKVERLTDQRLDALTLTKISDRVAEHFRRPGYQQPSDFERVLLTTVREQVQRALVSSTP